MTLTILTPCPTCGKRFDFPLTGCVTGVVEMLLASTDGYCPECGTLVVVDETPAQHRSPNLFVTTSDARSIPIVNLELSVRCRLALARLPANTVGDLIDQGRDVVVDHLGAETTCCRDLLKLFAEKRVNW